MLRRLLASLPLAAALLAPAAPAQPCPFNVAFVSTGTTCNPGAAVPSILSGSFANGAAGCSVTLSLAIAPSCCNTFVTGRFLVLGFAPAAIPIPPCVLLAFPDFVLPVPASPASLAFALPPDPALVGLVVYAQGIVVRFTTIGMTTSIEFTNRLDVLFQ